MAKCLRILGPAAGFQRSAYKVPIPSERITRVKIQWRRMKILRNDLRNAAGMEGGPPEAPRRDEQSKASLALHC